MGYLAGPAPPGGTAAPVAQLDRVLDSESKGRRFESCRVRHNDFKALFSLVLLASFPQTFKLVWERACAIARQAIDCSLSEPPLLCCLRVPSHLVQGGMTRDRRNLVGGTSGLSEPTRRGLAQPVGDTPVGQAGLSDLVGHEVAKALGGEVLAVPRLQDRAFTPRPGLEKGPQIGMDSACCASAAGRHPFSGTRV